MKSWLVKLINVYQSRGGGSRLNTDCNFEPSCSEYTKVALEKHGLRSGLSLAYRRLKKCNQPDLVNKINDPVPPLV